MEFIPAIDLKDNKCVRLQKGVESDVTIFSKNPIEQAKFFENNGCKRIHIVDLDAAFGRQNINKKTILDIRKNTSVSIELRGGIRDEKDISFWIDEGINFLIVGSLAIKNKNLVKKMINSYKNKIYVALDILEEKIMIKGWTEDSKFKIYDALNFYNNTNVAGFILTDISRDGMLEGLDINLIEKFLTKTKKNLVVGGGLSSYNDLYNLKKIHTSNLEGVISGKSFYSGNIEIKKAMDILKPNA